MKSLVFVIHVYSSIFLGMTLLSSIGAFFEADWGKCLRSYGPTLRKMCVLWGVLLFVLFLLGKKFFPFDYYKGHKAFYFETWFLALRNILYVTLLYASLKQIEKRPALSLIAVFFISNFFAFDWGMSLERKWYSNMYGLIYMSNGAQGAMALMTMRSFPHLSVQGRKDFVYLILTSAITWFYMHFSQFIIIWMGNLPEESQFYVERWYRFGSAVIIVVLLLKVLPPTIISMFDKLKLSPSIVKSISLTTLVCVVVEVLWYVKVL